MNRSTSFPLYTKLDARAHRVARVSSSASSGGARAHRVVFVRRRLIARARVRDEKTRGEAEEDDLDVIDAVARAFMARRALARVVPVERAHVGR